MMSSAHALQTQLSYANIQLIFSGDEYYVHMIEQINNAKKSICIESYIFDLDPIGLKILHALEMASKRGVHIRVLVDGVGTYNWIHQLKKECHNRKIYFRTYHPIPLFSDLWSHISWKNLNRMLLLFRRINKRNHRKVTLIDNTTVLMGSFNISQVHSETYMGKKAWRDSGLIANQFFDPTELQNLQDAFDEAWKTSKYFSRSHLRSFLRRRWRKSKLIKSRFRLNSRPYWRFRLLRDLNAKIKQSQNLVYITNAYFVPRKSILHNLRRAARRGVEVVLLLPEKTDVWFVREASRSLYRRLLLSGAKIYEYHPRVLHAKTLIIDDWATVGSHNLNHRSFNHDLEVESVLTEPELISNLKKQWQEDLKKSKEVTIQELGKYSFLRRIVSRILYWFRFWL